MRSFSALVRSKFILVRPQVSTADFSVTSHKMVKDNETVIE